MHDVFPKFIVEGNNLIIAKCTYHKQLVTDATQVKGGGMWEWDKEAKTFTLHGESEDFGVATAFEIMTCIKAGNVFVGYVGGRSISDHTFYLKKGVELIKLN